MWVVEDERVERNASLCMGIVDQGKVSHLKWRVGGGEQERGQRNSRYWERGCIEDWEV